jgi:transcriptional regulator with XRE-family HTH domain
MAERMLLAFGRYLKLVRERRKLSLEDVAALTKSYPEPINKGYLSRVERGLARVGFSKMVALSRAYEVPLDAFGEKLALDLEVDQLKDAPETKGKNYRQLMEEAMAFSQRGMRWHSYACVRDALPRAVVDTPSGKSRNLRDQVTAAALSHGIATGSLGRYALALCEFGFVEQNSDALSEERLPVVFQQSATAKRRLGLLDEARVLADKAVALAEKTPKRRHLGDALEVHSHLAAQSGDYASAIAFSQRAFTAYKAVGSRLDCARSLNNLAQFYFDAKRFKAARRALSAADRLARDLQADSIRARVRILLGEIESIDAHHEKAASLWHEAVEIARQTHDSVVHFKAEFQLFKLAILQSNATIVNALGRRLDRMTPWISRSEPEVDEFRLLYAIHRKPKQRSVAARQLARS